MQFLERFYHKRLLRDKDDTYGIKCVFYEGKRDNVSCFLALHSLFLYFSVSYLILAEIISSRGERN